MAQWATGFQNFFLPRTLSRSENSVKIIVKEKVKCIKLINTAEFVKLMLPYNGEEMTELKITHQTNEEI